MKIVTLLTRYRLPSVGAALLILMPVLLWAEHRFIVTEEFTNQGGEISNQMRFALDRASKDFAGEVIPIRYHVFWPDNADPLYLPLKDRGRSRIFYYGVKHLPDVRLNGRAVMETLPAYRTYRTFRDTLAAAVQKNTTAAWNLSVFFHYKTSEQCSLQTLCHKLNSGGANDLVLHCLVLEDNVKLRNNQLEDDVARYFVTEPEGLPLNFSGRDTIIFNKNFSLDPGFRKQNLKAVAFIQNLQTREILQAATTRPRHRLMCPNPLRALGPGQTTTMAVALRNSRSDSAVTFVVDDFQAIGSKLDGQIQLLYPNTINEKKQPFLRLEALAADSLIIQAQSGLQRGTARYWVSVVPENQGDASLKVPISILVIDPQTVLLVDDDGFGTYETDYQESLPERFPRATWEREWQPLTAEILTNSVGVVWFTGRAYPTLDSKDRSALARYLDQGGRLLITGQDIGWELCDAGSPVFNPDGSTTAFYKNYLSAEYLHDSADMQYVFTPVDQPDLDSLITKLDESQAFPSVIRPINSASAFLAYHDTSLAGASAEERQEQFLNSPKAGVRSLKGTARVAYVAFGLEGISTKTDLAQLLGNVLNWLGIDTSATTVTEKSVFLDRFALAANYPNPFNARTVIEFTVPVSTPVCLEVFDILGRRLETLFESPRAVGHYRIPFDGSLYPSGIYFYRIQVGQQTVSRKMILLK